jgi:hypothetical protein
MPDPDVSKTAKEFIDRALAARGRLGYPTKVSKKSYGLAIDQAAGVFQALRATSGDRKERTHRSSREPL